MKTVALLLTAWLGWVGWKRLPRLKPKVLLWLTKDGGYVINAGLTMPNELADPVAGPIKGVSVENMTFLGSPPGDEAFFRFADTDHVSLRPWS